MLDILSAFYHDGPFSFDVLSSLDNPVTTEEHKLRTQLRTVDEKVAEALKTSIEVLADKQAERAFYSGARFGAQLMAQLLEDIS